METAILITAKAGLFTALMNERIRHDAHIKELETKYTERMERMELRIFSLVENIVDDKVNDTKKLTPEQIDKIKKKIENKKEFTFTYIPAIESDLERLKKATDRIEKILENKKDENSTPDTNPS